VLSRTPCGGRFTIPMVTNKITCNTGSSPTSWEQLQAILREQGVALKTGIQRVLLDLVAGGEMVCKSVCSIKDGPKDGPFLAVVKISLGDKDKYAALLTKLTGDNSLALLVEPSGPAYVQVLRCRPPFWTLLRQSCMQSLGWGPKKPPDGEP
jgi:hypothetical protein